jgi:hypothetical protein
MPQKKNKFGIQMPVHLREPGEAEGTSDDRLPEGEARTLSDKA